MDVVAAYFERFNVKKLDEMADLFGSGYSIPGVEARLLDNDGHLTLAEHRIDDVYGHRLKPALAGAAARWLRQP